MPNDFINTITTNNGTTYDVQDKRLTVTAADAGKVVSVDENGDLSLTTPSSGTKLYLHTIKFASYPTIDRLVVTTNGITTEQCAPSSGYKTFQLITDDGEPYSFVDLIGRIYTGKLWIGDTAYSFVGTDNNDGILFIGNVGYPTSTGFYYLRFNRNHAPDISSDDVIPLYR